MEEGFEGKLVVRAFVLFSPNSLDCGVRHHLLESYHGKPNSISGLVKGMEQIVDATVHGPPARLSAHGAELGYDERFGISQVEPRDEQVRVFRRPFVGHRLCPR